MLNLPHLKDTSVTSGELLESGNYAYAFHKATDPETRACAKIMCGSIKTGLAELLAFKNLSKTSLLTQAYGYWCLTETTRALKILTGMQGKIPQKLANFIEKGAEVLLYTPSGTERIESFENIKLSYHSIDPEKFKENIAGVDSSRDLVISYGVYGVNLPKNIFNLNCPTAFWVGDHDFFMQPVIMIFPVQQYW